MLYDVLKDVIIDGHRHQAGGTVEIKHDKTHRLVNLGYIKVHEEAVTNRAVSTITRKRRHARN